VADIIGGLHLINPPRKQLEGTLAYLKELGPTKVHACHCTDLKSKIALSGVVNLEEVGVGTVIHYD
jgi:7,8-dihydropterin-6-yl-methyl-4-(beta-D-ribofuranosyl)aminobenzene 5'-phosphate synthase